MKSVETQARCWQVCLSLSFPSDDLNILLAFESDGSTLAFQYQQTGASL